MLSRALHTFLGTSRTSKQSVGVIGRRTLMDRPLLHPFRHLFDLKVGEDPEVFKRIDEAKHVLSTYSWSADEGKGESERSVIVSSTTKDGQTWDCKVVINENGQESVSEATGDSFEAAKDAATQKARESLGGGNGSPELAQPSEGAVKPEDVGQMAK